MPYPHCSILSLNQSCGCPPFQGVLGHWPLRKPQGTAKTLQLEQGLASIKSSVSLSVDTTSSDPHSGFYEHQDVSKALYGAPGSLLGISSTVTGRTGDRQSLTVWNHIPDKPLPCLCPGQTPPHSTLVASSVHSTIIECVVRTEAVTSYQTHRAVPGLKEISHQWEMC